MAMTTSAASKPRALAPGASFPRARLVRVAFDLFFAVAMKAQYSLRLAGFNTGQLVPKNTHRVALDGRACRQEYSRSAIPIANDQWRRQLFKTPRSIPGAILLAGVIAGTIDIGAAALINAASIAVILKAIASGILGKASFERGIEAESLGLLLQWAMSILIAAIFVITASRVNILKRQWLAAGLAYGVVVFFVMNYLVVPLSAIGRIPHFTALRFLTNLLAMLLFGAIIAFFARSAHTIAGED